MKLLILGGTVFLGRHIVEAARAAGHEITLFNRGRSGPQLFPDLENITGDRNGDLEALRGRNWDVAIDTCGYLPRVVRKSTELLRDQGTHYTFLSTVSVYKDRGQSNQDETAPLVTPLHSEYSEITGETYGPLKAACEQVVRDSMPARALIIRPGLIVGPHDPTDRFTYWPARVARGGEVLAPGNPDRLVQVIDVRDLADWIVRMATARRIGAYNACGPGVAMQEILALCYKETGSLAEFTWVSDAFLQEQSLVPYTEIPLWIPGINDSFNTEAARVRGLVCRSLGKTIQDTLAWDVTRADVQNRKNGLGTDREAELLKKWHEVQKKRVSVNI